MGSRVREARERQEQRLRGTGRQTNGEVSEPFLRRQLPLPDGLQVVERAVNPGKLSPRRGQSAPGRVSLKPSARRPLPGGDPWP